MKKRKFKLWFYFILSTMTCVLAILLCSKCIAIRSLDLIEVPIASKNILPRSQIESDDIVLIKMPNSYLPNEIKLNQEEVVGKYTSIQGKIPAGSFFYGDMLFDRTQMPDFPHTMLKSKQASYTLETDYIKLGGTLVTNQRVDIHVTLKLDDNKTVNGILFKNVRVLAIKDHQGTDIEDEKSSGMPHIVILAINREDLPILTKAESLGEIRLFASDETYDTKQEATLDKDSTIYRLLSMTE